MKRRTLLGTTAVVAATAPFAKLSGQAIIKVPTCPDSVEQPGPNKFDDGPAIFRQTPIKPVAQGGILPPDWKNGFEVGAGPCGIAKEFGPTTISGADVPEFLDDDDPNSPGNRALQNLMKEFGGKESLRTEYYEVVIGEGSKRLSAIEAISGSATPVHFLGYGPFDKEEVTKGGEPLNTAMKSPTWPGPMFQARVGKPMVIRFINQTDDYMSVHLHGGHGPAHSDGHPAFVIPKRSEAGDSSVTGYGKNHRDYFYPHTVPAKKPTERPTNEGAPNSQQNAKNLDYSESPSTMWYHDHSMDITGPHVALGLAGFFPAFDDHELGLLRNGTLPFCPPAGKKVKDMSLDEVFEAQKRNPFDICLALQDRCFALNQANAGDPPLNQILYSVKGHNGHLGHFVTVNGELYPHTMVVPRKYRVRILDGSNARIYKLALYARIEKRDVSGHYRGADTNAKSLVALRGKMELKKPEWFRIGADTWLFPHAVRQHKVLVTMAKRADMVIDFEAIKDRAKTIFERENDLQPDEVISVYLCNLLDQENGRGPKIKLPDGNAQEPIAGTGGPAAIPSFQAINVDGDTNKGELDDPWPLMKFIIEPDLAKHELDQQNPGPPPSPPVNLTAASKKAPVKKGIPKAPPPATNEPQLGNMRTDFKSLGYNNLSEVPLSASVTLGTPLREHIQIREDEIVRKREVVFHRGNGIWQINGKVVDEFLSNFVPEINTAEEWILENGGGGWWHPIHIHLESHQQIEFLEELDVDEFKLVIGQIISTYEQAIIDERALGNIADASTLESILTTLKSSLAPVENRPLDDRGNLRRGENDDISLQKLTKTSVKRLGEFGGERAGNLAAPASPELRAAFLRLKKTYGGVAELVREFAPDLVFEDHRLWDRVQIQEWDRFKSDTTILGPNTRVKIRMKFRTFDGPFVFHCHNLEHEDMRMMFVFDPRPTPPGVLAAAEAAPSEAARAEISNDFHLREQPVCYRHPWRFTEPLAADKGAHKDTLTDSECVKSPDWHDTTGISKTPRAHPIWGGWDQHI